MIQVINTSLQWLAIAVRTSPYGVLTTFVPPSSQAPLVTPPGGFSSEQLALAEAACAAVGLADTSGDVAGSAGWYSVAS